MRTTRIAGIISLLTGLQLLPVADGIAKHMSAEYPVLLLVWGRYTFHLLAVLPIALCGPKSSSPTSV